MALSELDQMRVRKVVAKHLGLEPRNVLLHHRLASDLGADSLDMVEVTLALEDEFELHCLELPDDHDPSVQCYVDTLAKVLVVH